MKLRAGTWQLQTCCKRLGGWRTHAAWVQDTRALRRRRKNPWKTADLRTLMRLPAVAASTVHRLPLQGSLAHRWTHLWRESRLIVQWAWTVLAMQAPFSTSLTQRRVILRI